MGRHKGSKNKISKQIKFICKTCNKKWFDYPSRKKRKKFCSQKCSAFSRIEQLRKRSIGNKWGSLKKITPEFRKKISIAHKGKKRPNIAKSKFGNQNPNWKGGITPINKRIRLSANFRHWREEVFKRDNFTCQKCYKKGGDLHPHHIKSFSLYPMLRFEISNGLTLCASCHRQTDSWGSKLPTEQK